MGRAKDRQHLCKSVSRRCVGENHNGWKKTTATQSVINSPCTPCLSLGYRLILQHLHSSKAVVRICILLSTLALSSVEDHSSCMIIQHTHTALQPLLNRYVGRRQQVRWKETKMSSCIISKWHNTPRRLELLANASDLQAQFVRVCSNNQVLSADGKHRRTVCHTGSTKQVKQATAW